MNDLRSRVDELEHRVVQLYSSTPFSHAITDLPAYSATLREQNYPNLYVQAFYLDSDVWSSSELTRQPNNIILSAEVLAYLDNVDDIKRKYFNSAHVWMPIISKMRFDRLTHSGVGRIRPDVALLLLCMKLVSGGMAEDENKPSDLYMTAKQVCVTLERDGLLTLRSLQASLLLAVYEVGHAIYPAASLTLGRCVRQGTALGLHNKDAPQLAGKLRSWVDWEERQRGWWMIVILDRFIVVGTSNQPLCTDDPSKDTILPSCEPAWDSGIIVPPVRVLLSSMDTDPTLISPFARLGQAANLLGRVIRHCNDTTADVEHVLENAELLFGTITSLLDILATDNHASHPSSNAATAFCLRYIVPSTLKLLF
ncbi:hypothetical protein N7510_005170 [Penicillium lagena]|uniref:uncharacterized protein n=1 Tax=Penicillium lagena TaxID=94218 RepID=UPI0025415E4C|nr:uncharacterized protein N7510_005170 [Penicillium lagena]KAJ5611976.1 hypothetical protein N7510_005170 [Penicillium lagena]